MDGGKFNPLWPFSVNRQVILPEWPAGFIRAAWPAVTACGMAGSLFLTDDDTGILCKENGSAGCKSCP